MNMTVIESFRKIPDFVDELLEYRDNYDEPTHFIDIIWNHDIKYPVCYGIVILRHDCRDSPASPIPRKSWFIDTVRMPPPFMYIAGVRPAGQSVTLAALLQGIHFACFDATAVTTAFRACFLMSDFDHLHDVQMQALGALGSRAPPLSEVRQQLSFVNILQRMEFEKWPVTWDCFELSNADAFIRVTGGPLVFIQRPMPNEVVNRYVAGICHLVAIYKWHKARIARFNLGPEAHARIRQLSRDRARQGCLVALARGHRPLHELPIVDLWDLYPNPQ